MTDTFPSLVEGPNALRIGDKVRLRNGNILSYVGISPRSAFRGERLITTNYELMRLFYLPLSGRGYHYGENYDIVAIIRPARSGSLDEVELDKARTVMDYFQLTKVLQCHGELVEPNPSRYSNRDLINRY